MTWNWQQSDWPSYGMEWNGRPGRIKVARQRYLDAVLESLPIIPYTEQTAYEHARIWAELEVSGEMIGFYDLIVGAMALERGSEVAMLNKRHFGQIRELSVIEPK
jgi:tRNA(fMet)-specific endonuclease VapC